MSPPPLERPPWHGNAAGSQAWTGKMGLFTFYEAESNLVVENPDPAQPPFVDELLETEMIGRFGLGVGYQHFVGDDFALIVGVEGRYTEPVVQNPPQAPPSFQTDVFVPGDVVQFQATIGSRWWLPVRWADQGRLRPFVGLDLNYIPDTDFDVVATLNDSIQIPFEFSGSPYWTVGLCLGLSFQWSDNVVVHLTAFHETALSKSEDVNYLEIPGIPPGVIPPLETKTTVDAQGWIGFLSVSWGF